MASFLTPGTSGDFGGLPGSTSVVLPVLLRFDGTPPSGSQGLCKFSVTKSGKFKTLGRQWLSAKVQAWCLLTKITKKGRLTRGETYLETMSIGNERDEESQR